MASDGLRVGATGLDPKNLRRPMKGYPVTRGELYNVFHGKALASAFLAVFSGLFGVMLTDWIRARSAGEETSVDPYMLLWGVVSLGFLLFIVISGYWTAWKIEKECIDPEQDV